MSWCFIRQPWFYNYNVSGAIEVPTRSLFGVPITGATATDTTRYFVVLGFVVVMTWIASNLVHGRIGRMWMAVRDMDLAAELTGIRLLPTKLLAFATSSFYCGVAGALLVFLWYGGAEPAVFDVNLSFFILFMVIIGGLGSLTGSFFGAALIFIMPIVLRYFPPKLGIPIHPATVEHIQYMIIGALIVLFLIAEPRGPRPVVADWQAEIEGVAFPLLTRHNLAQHPGRGDGRGAAPTAEEQQAATPPGKTKGRKTRCDCTVVCSGRLLRLSPGLSFAPVTASAADSIFVPLLSYRTGPFAVSGAPIMNGMADYLNMLNERDGGIGGVKISSRNARPATTPRKVSNATSR